MKKMLVPVGFTHILGPQGFEDVVCQGTTKPRANEITVKKKKKEEKTDLFIFNTLVKLII